MSHKDMVGTGNEDRPQGASPGDAHNVIEGQGNRGKSTVIGRLLSYTGSLPEGKQLKGPPVDKSRLLAESKRWLQSLRDTGPRRDVRLAFSLPSAAGLDDHREQYRQDTLRLLYSIEERRQVRSRGGWVAAFENSRQALYA